MRVIFLYDQYECGKEAPTQGFFSSDIFVEVEHIVLTAVNGIAVLFMDAVKAVFRKQVMKSCEYAFPRFDDDVVLYGSLQMEVKRGVERIVDTVERDTAEVFCAHLGRLGICDEITFI